MSLHWWKTLSALAFVRCYINKVLFDWFFSPPHFFIFNLFIVLMYSELFNLDNTWTLFLQWIHVSSPSSAGIKNPKCLVKTVSLTALENSKFKISISSNVGLYSLVLNQSGVWELCAVSVSAQGHVWFTEDITISTITVRKHEISMSEIYCCCCSVASALTYNAPALILTFLAPTHTLQFAGRSNVAICSIPRYVVNSVTVNWKKCVGSPKSPASIYAAKGDLLHVT